VDLNALFIIPILAFLIFIHELGHFWTARRAGMRVEEFGFGLPPRIWGFRRGPTLYSINLIPLGGFVRVLGEDGKTFSPESMQSKSIGQRALFFAGGSIMNFAMAFVLLAILVGFQGTSTDRVYITEVAPESPAAAAGWQPGDRFVSIDGKEINERGDVTDLTADHAGRPMTVVLDRNGELITTSVVPRKDPPPGQGRTGITFSSAPVSTVKVVRVDADGIAAASGLREDDRLLTVNGRPVTDALVFQIQLREHAGQAIPVEVERDGQRLALDLQVPSDAADETRDLGLVLLQSVKFSSVDIIDVPGETVRQYFSMMQRMGEGLMSLIRGETPFSDVAGPIGMGQLTSEVIEESSLPVWVTLLNISFILSLNLGFLNLLPLPALDGGRLAFIVVEIARRGKRVAPEKEGLVHLVGFAILLTLMFVIAFADLNRIFSGSSLIE
jgi:regulator of sigma E protease